MGYARLLLATLICSLVLGCTPSTTDSNAGQNIQLNQRLTEKDSRIAVLEQEVAELRERDIRTRTKLAEHESGTFEKEEQQRLLDERKASLDAREKNLIERETTVEGQISQRRAELSTEQKAREDQIAQRENSISTKEKEFYERTNLTMEDIGKAREISSQYENMRSERNAANSTAEKWLAFVWYVSIALGIAILACVSLVFVTVSKHLSAQRELENRREVAQLLSTAIKAQLPPEQGRLVVDAMNRLTRIESAIDPGKIE